MVTNQARCELDVGKAAELPELLRGTTVLKDDLVGLEGIELAGTKAVNSLAQTPNKLGQTSLVIRRHNLACSPALRLVGHIARLLSRTAAGRTSTATYLIAA